MCYYDNYRFACNDWKWGNFRQHCQREYRTGETCGHKMIYHTIQRDDKCRLCDGIERKKRRYDKHHADYQRWCQEPQKYRYSIEKAVEEMRQLCDEIKALQSEKDQKYRMIGNPRRA